MAIGVLIVVYIALNENIIISDCISRDDAISFHYNFMEATVGGNDRPEGFAVKDEERHNVACYVSYEVVNI